MIDEQRRSAQVSSRVAMVMPEMGLDDEPTSPVRREDTVTNRKPNTRISNAAKKPKTVKPRPICGINISTSDQAKAAEQDHVHRHIALGADDGFAARCARLAADRASPRRWS